MYIAQNIYAFIKLKFVSAGDEATSLNFGTTIPNISIIRYYQSAETNAIWKINKTETIKFNENWIEHKMTSNQFPIIQISVAMLDEWWNVWVCYAFYIYLDYKASDKR